MVDEQGWNSDSKIFEYLINWLRPSLIIEVGTWKGRSAIRMALIAKALNLRCEVVCIDTWLRSPEHWNETAWRPSLKLQHGRPNLYQTFLNNVKFRGLEDSITPLSMTSSCAAKVLENHHVTAKLIFIDGAHDYEAVYSDLTMYFALLENGGVILIDDYLGWDSVTMAADDFAKSKGTKIIGEEGKGILAKGVKLPFKQRLLYG